MTPIWRRRRPRAKVFIGDFILPKRCHKIRLPVGESHSRAAIILEEPALFARRTKQRANKAFELDIEFDYHMVGTARQSEARSKVVLDPVWKFAPGDRKNIVLLLRQWIGIIHQPDPAVEFHARREVAHPAIIDRRRIPVFKALIM